jgi:hypothetical protein
MQTSAPPKKRFAKSLVIFSLAITALVQQPPCASADALYMAALCNALLQNQLEAQLLPPPGSFATLARPLPFYKQDVGGKCGPTTWAIAIGYFGRAPGTVLNPFDPFAAVNTATGSVLAVSSYKAHQRGQPLRSLEEACLHINGSFDLADSARAVGLFAKTQTATLAQIQTYIRNQEVVMVHWWMGPQPWDDHWSAFQSLGSDSLELRDPWPWNPAANQKSTREFLYRGTTGQMGQFYIVRISDRPVFF